MIAAPSPLGFQIQRTGPGARAMTLAALPWTIKVLEGGVDLDTLGEWRSHRPHGPLVGRHRFDPGPLEQMGARLEASYATFDGLLALPGPSAVEVPYNEEHQQGEAFVRLAEASVAAAVDLIARGFRAVVLVTSEGNPPGEGADPFAEWRDPRVQAALRELRKLASRPGDPVPWVFWGPHEYSAPPLPAVDGWHLGRWRRVLELLPEPCRLPVLITETGIDGGVDTGLAPKRAETGWRGYLDAANYAWWLREVRAAIADDRRVWGAHVFGLSLWDNWRLFDIAGEPELAAVFAETVASPERWNPTPEAENGGGRPETPPAPPPSPVPQPEPARLTPRGPRLSVGLQYRMGVDVPETSFAALAALCRRMGATVITPKAADGDAWLASIQRRGRSIDPDPVLAIHTADDLRRQRDEYAELGIALHPWVVPRGMAVGREAELHAQVARICGVVLVDFERYYGGFWGDSTNGMRLAGHADPGQSWRLALEYFDRLRNAAPSAELVFQGVHAQVARPEAADGVPIAEVRRYFDRHALQLYWPLFRRPAVAVLAEGLEALDWGDLAADATIYSSDASHPADVEGTEAALAYVTGSWRGRSDGPTLYVFSRSGVEPLIPTLAKWAGTPLERRRPPRAELSTYAVWALERYANGEDARGDAGLADFRQHLAGIGADPADPGRYGWPMEVGVR